MNRDLKDIILRAIGVSTKPGIDVRDTGHSQTLRVSTKAVTQAAQDPWSALERIQTDQNQYRIIALEGVTLSLIGTEEGEDEADRANWYSVELPNGQSFAIVHRFTARADHGAECCDLDQVPEYLLLNQVVRAIGCSVVPTGENSGEI